jgi:hypothetical protein
MSESSAQNLLPETVRLKGLTWILWSLGRIDSLDNILPLSGKEKGYMLDVVRGIALLRL